MKNTYKIIWSDEALKNLKGIIKYLEYRWTEREIRRFSKLLDKKLGVIQANPLLFPKLDRNNQLRKAVLSKQTPFYYTVIGDKVTIVTLFDNRKNLPKLYS